MTQEALKLALEALKELVAQVEGRYFCMKNDHVSLQNARFAIARAREALAQEQEPVAWRVSPRYEDSDGYFDFTDSKDTADTLQKRGWTITPLYTIPPQRTWVGLTKEQLATTDWSADFRAGALWAEAKLKEVNNG